MAQATMLFLVAPFANIHFYSSIDNEYIHHKVWEKITHPFHNLNGTADGVWSLISDFILHFTGYAR